MDINLSTNLHNYFDIEVVRDNKTIRKCRAFNLVTNLAYSQIYSGAAFPTMLSMGTGTGTPTATNSTLFKSLFALDGGREYTFDDKTLIGTLTRRVTLLPTDYPGAVFTEIGLGQGTAMWTHALLTDSLGNPISITKGPADKFIITAKVFIEIVLNTSIPNVKAVANPLGIQLLMLSLTGIRRPYNWSDYMNVIPCLGTPIGGLTPKPCPTALQQSSQWGSGMFMADVFSCSYNSNTMTYSMQTRLNIGSGQGFVSGLSVGLGRAYDGYQPHIQLFYMYLKDVLPTNTLTYSNITLGTGSGSTSVFKLSQPAIDLLIKQNGTLVPSNEYTLVQIGYSQTGGIGNIHTDTSRLSIIGNKLIHFSGPTDGRRYNRIEGYSIHDLDTGLTKGYMTPGDAYNWGAESNGLGGVVALGPMFFCASSYYFSSYTYKTMCVVINPDTGELVSFGNSATSQDYSNAGKLLHPAVKLGSSSKYVVGPYIVDTAVPNGSMPTLIEAVLNPTYYEVIDCSTPNLVLWSNKQSNAPTVRFNPLTEKYETYTNPLGVSKPATREIIFLNNTKVSWNVIGKVATFTFTKHAEDLSVLHTVNVVIDVNEPDGGYYGLFSVCLSDVPGIYYIRTNALDNNAGAFKGSKVAVYINFEEGLYSTAALGQATFAKCKAISDKGFTRYLSDKGQYGFGKPVYAVKFKTPPAPGTVITADYSVEELLKDENWILDANATLAVSR